MSGCRCSRLIAVATFFLLLFSSLAFSDCIGMVATSVTPIDGGTPPGAPAQIVVNGQGQPTDMAVGAPAAVPSELLILDDGGGGLPSCFVVGQTITVSINRELSSPASLSSSNVDNVVVVDSGGINGLLLLVSSSTMVSGGTANTVITLEVARNGTPGNPIFGLGSGVVLRHLGFNTAIGGGTGQLIATVSSTSGRMALPQAFQIGSIVTTGPVAISSFNLQFGNQIVDSTGAPLNLTLKNNGTLPITTDNFTTTAEFAQTNTCGATIAVGAACTVAVTFTPAALGSRTGTLTITDNTSNSPHVITLGGAGIASPGLPAITSMNPTVAVAGGPPFTLFVSGSNFAPGSTIQWNGAPRSTNFVDASTLSTAITSTDLTTAAQVTVSVINAGSGTSNSLTLTIVPSPVPASAFTYVLPHIVFGGGFATNITLINLTSASNAATVNFISQSGTIVQTSTNVLPPHGTLRMSPPSATRTGPSVTEWAVIGASGALAANLFFELADSSGKVLNTVGFNAGPAQTDLSMPVEFEPPAQTGAYGRTVGIALANMSDTSNPVTLKLLDSTGAKVGTYPLILQPFNQTAIDLSTITQFSTNLPNGNFLGTLTLQAQRPVGAIGLGDDLGQFAATPPSLGRPNFNVDDITAICPSADEISSFNKALSLSFESDPTAGTLVCRAASGSADLTPLQLRAYQALRVLNSVSFDVPIPFTTKQLFPWLTAAIKGIRFRGDIASSSCCSPANVINIAVTANSPALQTSNWLGPLGLSANVGLDDFVSSIARLARISEGAGNTCGAKDNTIGEMGPWATALDMYVFTAGHGGTFFDDNLSGEFLERYRTVALSNATGTISANFCTPATVEIQPNSVNFGSQPVGDPLLLRTIGISAGTSTPFFLRGLSISGPNAADFKVVGNTCGSFQVPPNCTVTVSFKPSLQGQEFATLNVAETIDQGPLPVPMNGSGTAIGPFPSANYTYVLPHIVTGQGYVTKITITNLTNVANDIVINYLDQSGNVTSRVPYTLAASGSLRISTAEASRFGASTVQWAIVGSRQPISANAFFEIENSSNTVVNTVGFNSASPMTKFTFPVEVQLDANGNPGTHTSGLAVANPSAGLVIVTMNLLDGNGFTVASEMRTLAAYGQMALDLNTLPSFQTAVGKSDFIGSVQVQAATPVAAIALQSDLGQFSATPVIPAP